MTNVIFNKDLNTLVSIQLLKKSLLIFAKFPIQDDVAF